MNIFSLLPGVGPFGREQPVIAGPEGNLQGKKIVHWSYYFLLTGTVAGAATAISAYAMTMPLISLAGLALFLSNGIGSHYVKEFSSLKILEGYVSNLTQRIKDFSAEIAALKQEKNELEVICAGIKEVPTEWRTAIAVGQMRMQEQADEIARLTQELNKTQGKFAKLGSALSGEIKKTTVSIAQEAVKMCRENGMLGESVNVLEKKVAENRENIVRFESGIHLLDVNTDQFEEVNKAFGQQIGMLSSLFAVVQKIYERAKEKMEELARKQAELGVIVPKAVESTDRVEAVEKELLTLRNALKEELDSLNQKLQECRQWKNSVEYKQYQHYRHRKSTPEYQDYLEWRQRKV